MKQLKVKTYLHILITLFIVLITGASFAIYADRNDYSATANIEAIVGSGGSEYVFTATSIKNFSLNVNPENLSESSVGNYIESDTGTIKVNLENNVDDDVTCTFDLLFTWTSSDKYLNPSIELPYTNGGTTYNYEYSTLVNGENERDLSKVNNGTGFDENYSGTIAEGLSITAYSNESSEISYNITSRFYNLPVDQGDIMGKKMSSTIKVDNVDCQYEIEEDIDVSTLNYLSTNRDNTIFNLVNKQGVDVTNVDSVYFVDTRRTKPGSAENIALFKGTDGNAIKAWTNGNNLYIGSKGTTYPGPSMTYAFYNMQNLNVLDMNNVNTSNVTNMSNMFWATGDNSTVFTLNLGNQFNTSNVTNMYKMFQYTGDNSTVFTLNLGSEFNTSKVTDMSYMFSRAGNSSPVFTLNLGNEFNTSNVTDMYKMFDSTGADNTNFTLNLGNEFNTSKVTNMSGMFFDTGFESTVFTLNLGNEFNTSKVTDMAYMFYRTGYRSTDFTLNLGNQFNTSNVTSMYQMFYRTGLNSTIFTLNLGNEFNTSKVTNMAWMFESTGYNITNFTLNLGSKFNTSNVTSMYQMFRNTGGRSTNFTLNLGNQFNTSKVTNMHYMFSDTGYSSSWTLNLKSFDFSKVGSKYNNFFTTRTSSKILTVLCSPTNGDFINARVSGLTGYNIVCS